LKGNQELEGLYVPARNMDELISGVGKLKDESYYNDMSSKILALSENYHISKISELYRSLK
jgi:hypothetical protein